MNSTMSSLLRLGQHLLEHRVRVAFLRHRERGAELHGARAQRDELAHAFRRLDAARDDEGNLLALDAELLEEPEACPRSTVANSKRASLRSSIFAAPRWPPAQRGCSITMASGSRFLRIHFFSTTPMPRASERIGTIATSGWCAGEVGQVERQAGAHHDRLDAAFARLAHVGRVLRDRAHDVHGHDAACRRRARARRGSRGRAPRGWRGRSRPCRATCPVSRHQVGVVAAQVHRRRACRRRRVPPRCRRGGARRRPRPCRPARWAALRGRGCAAAGGRW